MSIITSKPLKPATASRQLSVDRNIHTVTAEGSLSLYVEQKATKGFYYVAFRVPGANTGTP